MGGTHFEAVATVDATVGKQQGLAVANTQRFGRTRFHAVRTTDTGVFVDAKCVKESAVFHGFEFLSWLECCLDDVFVVVLCLSGAIFRKVMSAILFLVCYVGKISW